MGKIILNYVSAKTEKRKPLRKKYRNIGKAEVCSECFIEKPCECDDK